LETTAVSTAVLARSDAPIRQGEATDLWGYFQTASLKKHMYQIAAAAPGANTDESNVQVKLYQSQEADLQAKAKAKEDEVSHLVTTSEAALEHHHRLTYATNIVHLAIAIASISILVRRRWLWFGSLVCLGASIVVGLT
jgi:hypothetical protein